MAANESSDGSQQPKRCSSGVIGLDDILGGGMPEGQMYLIRGDPGAGKSTFAMQFMMEGARHGEKCLYVTLAENRAEFEQIAASHGWSLNGIEILELAGPDPDSGEQPTSTFFHAWETELARIRRKLMEEVQRVKPTRLVFDSLAEIRTVADSPFHFRQQIAPLRTYIRSNKCTAMLLDDRSGAATGAHVETHVHGVITLERRSPEYGIMRRRMIVEKMRGIQYREGYHDFRILHGGAQVYPRLIAAEHFTKFRPQELSSGLPQLDKMLGGGIARGTSTLLMGQTGIGKTTLILSYASAAASRGEKSFLCAFDENIPSMVHRGDSLGLKTSEYMEKGLIVIRKFNAAEISPGEFTALLRSEIEKHKACMIGIDTLNGYMKSMPQETFVELVLHELTTYMSQLGVTTFIAMDLHGVFHVSTAAVDVSYIADNAVLLRYFEAFGEMKRAMSVIKKRSGDHETAIREFQIQNTGIKLGEPLRKFRGVLTGSPEFYGEQAHLMAEQPVK
jgi:circadian clock protein KaiC